MEKTLNLMNVKFNFIYKNPPNYLLLILMIMKETLKREKINL